MNPYDQYPLDWTGYGPTGMGNAPSSMDMRRVGMQQFYTDRSAMAMQYRDPYINQAVQSVMQALTAAGNTPDAVRRQMFNTRGGQAALDAAMLARRTGALGYGDPVNFAANISSGVMGGGFRATTQGKDLWGAGAVMGMGNLAERASMGFQKSLLEGLYGKGSADPSRMYGFNMEEVSGVFNTLARRGGLGNVGTYVPDATLAQRIAMERDQSSNPEVRAALAKIKLDGTSEQSQMASVDAIISSTDNKQVQETLKRLKKNSGAFFLNDQEGDRVNTVIRETIKGLSSLADIYGDLTSPELQQKLEQISGMRITNDAQARRATSMVNSLRGAALAGGMDPRAFMDLSSDMQAMGQGAYMQVGGLDARMASSGRYGWAGMHTGIMTDSVIHSKLAQSNHEFLRGMGVNVGQAPTVDEIYADKQQGRLSTLRDRKAYVSALGGSQVFSGEQRGRVEQLLSEMQATMSISDPQQRYFAQTRIERQLQGEYASLYGSWGAAQNNRAVQIGFTEGSRSDTLSEFIDNNRRASVSMEPIAKRMREAGIGKGDEYARLFQNLGTRGMGTILQASKTTGAQMSGQQRAKVQRDTLIASGMTSQQADVIMGAFMDSDGRLVDSAGWEEMSGIIGNSAWAGGMSKADREAAAREELAQLGSNSARRRLGVSDKRLSMAGILDAFMGNGGKITPEMAAMMVIARDGDGMGLGQAAAGLDFSKGLTTEGMAKLQSLAGKKLDLHKKIGGGKYSSMEQLIAATKNDPILLLKAIKEMQNGDYGLNLDGSVNGMTAITNEAMDSLMKSGATDSLKMASVANQIGGALDLSDEDIKKMITGDGKIDMSRFNVEEIGFSNSKRGFLGVKKSIEMGAGAGRMKSLAAAISGANATQLDAFKHANVGNAITDKLKKQYDVYSQASDEGWGDKELTYTDPASGESKTSTVDQMRADLQAAINRLEGGGTGNLQNVGSIVVEGDIKVSGRVRDEDDD